MDIMSSVLEQMLQMGDAPTVEMPSDDLLERVERARAARQAQPWFEQFFYPQLRAEFLKDLAKCATPQQAYELSVQVRVLEAMAKAIRGQYRALPGLEEQVRSRGLDG